MISPTTNYNVTLPMLFMLVGVLHDFHTSGIACDCIIRSKRAVKDNWTPGMITRNLL